MATSLLTTKDIAKRFGVKPETVRAWVRAGQIPHLRVGRGTVRFILDEVEAALRRTPVRIATKRDDVDR